MAVKIQTRGGTAAQWTSSNPVLSERELGFETDTRKFKWGDGITAWNSLSYSVSVSAWGALTGALSNQTDLQSALDDKQATSGKDATGGYVGLTLFKINFKNALNTFTSFFTNSNTAARTYTFQDRNGTIADDTDLALKADKAGSKVIQLACSDETTALTAGTGKITFRMPFAMTVTAVRASLTTAQASGSIFTVDINEAGTTILSTKLTIDNTEKTSTTAVTAPVISDASLADDAEITVDIDQIGNGSAIGLKVTLIGQ